MPLCFCLEVEHSTEHLISDSQRFLGIMSYMWNQGYIGTKLRPQTSSGAYIASSITILEAIRAGVGFGSGTETNWYSGGSTVGCCLATKFLKMGRGDNGCGSELLGYIDSGVS